MKPQLKYSILFIFLLIIGFILIKLSSCSASPDKAFTSSGENKYDRIYQFDQNSINYYDSLFLKIYYSNSISIQDTIISDTSLYVDPVTAYLNKLPEVDSSFVIHNDEETEFWGDFFYHANDVEERSKNMVHYAYSLTPSNLYTYDDIIRLKKDADYQLEKSLADLPMVRIDEVLERQLLVNNRVIPLLKKSHVNKIIGKATCNSKGHLIVMAKDPDPKLRINPYAFIFFREHELAHISLGHIECKNGKPHRTNDKKLRKIQEYEADCEAMKVLYNYNDGQRIFDRAWSILNALPLRNSKTHPQPKSRAKYLDNICDPN